MPAPSSSSLIDVVDERDRPIGTIERGKVLTEGAAFRVSHVWLFSGHILLLQQLGKHRQRHPLQWGSSAAAYLYSGEGYQSAASRRLREELGVELPLRQFGITKMQDAKSTKFVALHLGYLPHPDQPEIREPEHIETLRYWAPRELERELKRNPETFTETFRHLYSFFMSQTGGVLAVH